MDDIAALGALKAPGVSDALAPMAIARKKMGEREATNVAEDFEAMFMTQMLQPMFSGIEPDETFGGGSAEETFRGMMVNEYGSMIAKTGGLGVASAVKAELLRAQEA